MRRPIKSLTCQHDKTNQLLFLKANHINIRFKVGSDYFNTAELIANQIQDHSPGPETAELLAQVSHLPVSVHFARLGQDIPSNASLKEVSVWPDLSELAQEIKSPLPERETPSWDIDSILKQSKIKNSDLFDGLAAHSLICEALNETLLSSISGCEKLGELGTLKKQNESLFFQVMIRILTQTHYVTMNCSQTLIPGFDQPSTIGEFIRRFAEQEQGHHLLLENSLRELGEASPNPELVTEKTKALMSLLQLAAKLNPLALAGLLSFFEGLNLEAADPFATLLSSSSRPKSALGIQRHWDINRNEKHNIVGENLSRLLPRVTKNHVTQACQIVELAARLKNQITKDLCQWN